MKNLITTAAALALTLGLAGSAPANPAGKLEAKESHRGHDFKGREYKGWESRYFDHRFGCYLYRHPESERYYYWCEREACYYPTEYCPYDTYAFGGGFVCSNCPVCEPRHRPVHNKGGFNNTIHPIPGKPAPNAPPFRLTGGTLLNPGQLAGNSHTTGQGTHKVPMEGKGAAKTPSNAVASHRPAGQNHK